MYRKLFDIQISHEYFGNIPSSTLRLRPDRETAELMRKYSIVADMTEGTLELFYDDEQLSRRIEGDGKEEQSFSFILSSSDLNFFNYTDDSMVSATEVVHYHNDSATKKLLLSEEVSKRKIGDRLQEHIAIVTVSSLFYKESALQKALSYTLLLPARATYWQYYLIKERRGVTYQIESHDQQITYHYIGSRDFSDTREILIYQSSVPIPLRQESSVRNSLIIESGGRSSVLFKRLAVPSSDRVYRYDGSDRKCSRVYINL